MISNKEICGCCNKNVLIGHRFLECHECQSIIHKKCFNVSKFTLTEDSTFICPHCQIVTVKKYNPFKKLLNIEHDDKFYADNWLESLDCITKASAVLDKCSFYKLKTVDQAVEEGCDFKTMFYNIDGNKTNFDTFATQFYMQKITYSVVALVETNTSADKGSLYQLSNYSHFYGDKIPNKAKGTGVCMYVHESFNATVNNKLCTTTKNLESLFVTINKGEIKLNVGVVYRSPNGNTTEFKKEYTYLTSLYPKNMKSIILGDFNFDLLKNSSTEVGKFEGPVLSTGFFPLISLPTHSTNQTQQSCIDNIITNDIESVMMSGVIDDITSHHKPIVAMFKLSLPEDTAVKPKQIQHYNYSEKNVDSLIQELEPLTHFFIR